MKKPNLPVIISAPSGTGKTTVCRRLIEKAPGLQFCVSHTTRSPRDDETEGVDYFFIPDEEFKSKIMKGDFIEWARVHNNYYGVDRNTIKHFQEQGLELMLELDSQGVDTLRQEGFKGIYIMIMPPSIKELEIRLNKRGTESPEKLFQRIEAGKQDILRYHLYEYLVTNDEVEETVDTILAIMRAEQCRSNRYTATSPDIKAILDVDEASDVTR